MDEIFRYGSLPIEYFRNQIDSMEASYANFPKEGDRTKLIESKLKNGDPTFCVFVQDMDFSYFAMEGRHRLVAFHRMGYRNIPILFVKRADKD